jgi:hypothetical protein
MSKSDRSRTERGDINDERVGGVGGEHGGDT